MTKEREERLKKFANDRATSEAVRAFVLSIFLKPRSKLDVHEQAAERIAINLLQDAWADLERLRTETGGKASDETSYV